MRKKPIHDLDRLNIILSYIIFPLFYFHVNALGQVARHVARFVPLPHRFAEDVENPAPGLAVPRFFDVRNDDAGRAARTAGNFRCAGT